MLIDESVNADYWLCARMAVVIHREQWRCWVSRLKSREVVQCGKWEGLDLKLNAQPVPLYEQQRSSLCRSLLSESLVSQHELLQSLELTGSQQKLEQVAEADS